MSRDEHSGPVFSLFKDEIKLVWDDAERKKVTILDISRFFPSVSFYNICSFCTIYLNVIFQKFSFFRKDFKGRQAALFVHGRANHKYD